MRRRVHFREDVDDDGEIVELHPLLQWDMVVVAWLVQQKEERPWLRSLVHSTTSRRRTQDISLLIWHVGSVKRGCWFVFITMIPEFGFPYFWICIGNMLAVVVLQYLAESPRPIDLYHPLWQWQDQRCIDEDTGGFPCVDCHMAIVVLLPAMLHTQSVVIQLIFVGIVVYIALCKLLLATRFISQVLGSWLMGFAGILIGNHGHVVVKSYKLTRGYTIGAIVALLVFSMIVLGMWIENNDSSLMGIPKQDFMEVFTNILNSDAPNPVSTSGISSARVHQYPGEAIANPARQQHRHDGNGVNDEEVAGKRDSFYFLMRGMRARALATKQSS
ncbi:Transmembrane protein [Phytophthora palmivora]|uniref:Transmembrane protein n=1 Tax=Phytophthora palmivora TaxID=4796 RepID=A0A2P4X8C0_9STRA|nr:Transmembrane protein [Phytophthora palmivora]